MKGALGSSYTPRLFEGARSKIGVERVCLRFQQRFLEYASNDSVVQGKAYTYPQVKTLLEAVTENGRRSTDELDILNQRASLERPGPRRTPEMESPDSAHAGALGFSWDSRSLHLPGPAREPKKPMFMLRKLMAEYVWDLVHLEGNPFTFVDVQTLLSGATVGGHRQSDAQQVLNQQRALELMARLVADPSIHLGKDLALQLHAKVAFEEALQWGCFRTGGVRIGGTSHVPPPADELDDRYRRGIDALERVADPLERALAYFFWGALSQFFFDGNKRTSRAVMNFILLRNGYYYLSVPGERKDSFDAIMVDFYERQDATAGMTFLLECYRSWD